jgi:hypothetical protein
MGIMKTLRRRWDNGLCDKHDKEDNDNSRKNGKDERGQHVNLIYIYIYTLIFPH